MRLPHNALLTTSLIASLLSGCSSCDESGSITRNHDGALDDMQGDLNTSQDMSRTHCGADEFVRDGMCRPCSPGTTNSPGGDAMLGPDTQCEAIVCGEDEFVQQHMCTACPPGATHSAGAMASGEDTQCEDACTPIFGVTCNLLVTDYLKASNLDKQDLFGWVVALDGDTLAIGAPLESSKGARAPDDNSLGFSGAVYLFERDPGTGAWIEQAYLKSPNPAAGDTFGHALALEGDTLVISANAEDQPDTTDLPNSDTFDSGTVYIFERRPTTKTWEHQSYLKASNPGRHDSFGHAVALEGDTLVVSAVYEDSGDPDDPLDNSATASGAAYVFERDAMTRTWRQQAYLKSLTPDVEDSFGWAVAIEGDSIFIGDSNDSSGDVNDPADQSAPSSGAVHEFRRDPATRTWRRTAYLKASPPSPESSFGHALTVEGDTLVVGAYRDSDGGAAHIFERDPVTRAWQQQTSLKPSDLKSGHSFGLAVTLAADTLIVGAQGDTSALATDDTTDSEREWVGAVYMYRREPDTGQWRELIKLTAFNPDVRDSFGVSLALDAQTLVVGAHQEASSSASTPLDNMSYGSGAAYVFDLSTR